MGGSDTLIGKDPPDVDLMAVLRQVVDVVKDMAYEAAAFDPLLPGFYKGPPFAKGVQPPRPVGFQPINPKHLTVELRKYADSMLEIGYPVGSRVEVEIDGKTYKFIAEWHQHPPTDNVSPALKEVHRGISIYEEK